MVRPCSCPASDESVEAAVSEVMWRQAQPSPARCQRELDRSAYVKPKAKNRIEEFMIARGKSLIVTPLISVLGVTLLAANARAEDCLAAPNSPAREGTRWYYRTDRITQHKCWYMRPLEQPTQQVDAPGKTALSASAFAIPIPRPRPASAGSALSSSSDDTDTSSSHAEYAIPIPKPRPLAAGPALSLSRGEPGNPSSSYPETIAAKPSTTSPVGGPAGESTLRISNESTSQQVGTSSAAPAPNAAPLIGAATDETTSAISEMRQAAPPSEPNAKATAPAPDAESLAGSMTNNTNSPTSNVAAPEQAATSSEPNVQKATLDPNAVPQINAPINEAASSTPNYSGAQLSTSSDFKSSDAEPIPDVSVAQPQVPLAGSSVNTRPTPHDAPDWTARRVQLIDNAQTLAKPFPLIFAFVLTLVGVLIRACVARGLGRVFIN
jgi:hypothetical protein